jgi:glycerate 2-kinase
MTAPPREFLEACSARWRPPAGRSGSSHDPAGAYVDSTTLGRARRLGLDPAAFLANNDSGAFFAGLGDRVIPGPTFTNVNDFRAIRVDVL